MIFEDLITINNSFIYKIDARKLGSFYIVSGYISNEAYNYLAQCLSEEKNNRSIGKHYCMAWRFVNNNLIIYYNAIDDKKDLFYNQKAKVRSLSEFLCSGESLVHYNLHLKWQKSDSRNYKTILDFKLIQSTIYELLKEFNIIKSMLVSSLEDFERLCPNGMMYRGQSSMSYQLLPSLFRDEWNEEKLYNEANRYLFFSNNYYENVAQMQHYGLPTRLLDITLDKYVALYMACNTVFNSAESINDIGAVYGFEPKKLLTLEEASDFCRPLERFSEKQFVGYYELKNNERIKKQKGSFIIFGDNSPIESDPICYVINKKQILKELDVIRRSELDLIPEKEHICNYIKQKYKHT